MVGASAGGGGGGGIDYVQDAEPSDPTEGDEWYDTGEGRAYVYDGSYWVEQTAAPVVTDEARSFDGSDGETVSTANGHVKAGGGTLSLYNDNDSVTWSDNGTQAGTYGDNYGVQFNPNGPVTAIKFTYMSGCGSDEDALEVVDESNNTVVKSKPGGFSDGSTVTVDLSSTSLTNGQKYTIRSVSSGDRSAPSQGSASFPYSGSVADIVGGYFGGSADDRHWIEKIEAVFKPSSGTGYVEWTNPDDVYSWESAYFQDSPDGETAEVYVEEDDGSGWTEVAGPIQRGADIPVAAGNEVRFRVELSRTDTANNPTVDAVFRRYQI